MKKTTPVVGVAVSILCVPAVLLLLQGFDPGVAARAQTGAAQTPRDRQPPSAAPAAHDDEEAALKRTLAADPANVQALRALAALYNRSGRFDLAIQSIERVAALRPADAEAHHVVGTYYLEKARDQTISAADKQTYIRRGIAAENEALAINPQYLEALVYKNLLLRVQALSEPDPVRQQALIREADELRTKAMQLQKSRAAAEVPVGTVIGLAGTPPPPPPPPPPGVPPASEMKWEYAKTDYTAASGPVPVRTKDVRPIYPPVAVSAGYEGTVILEATVDRRGRVAQVKVVQSLPLLTQSTIDAVRQWEFDPASVGSDGSSVTVSADFRKSR